VLRRPAAGLHPVMRLSTEAPRAVSEWKQRRGSAAEARHRRRVLGWGLEIGPEMCA
jgi:hypothetical protein